jgi:hypothetical protein
MPLPFVAFALAFTLDSTEARHAVARRGCTQEDLPALEIFLTRERWDGAAPEPRAPYLRLEVAWGAWSRVGDRPLALLPLRRRAEDTLVVRGAWHVTPATPSWLTGTVRLRQVDVGRRVVGEYDVREPTGARRAGRFTARWVEAHSGCG